MEFITESAAQTQALAKELMEKLSSREHSGALVVALTGELGAGKTTFVQGLAEALGLEERVLSPTFVIMKHFDLSASEHFDDFYHVDCYRLTGPEDLGELGFEKILKNPKNLVVIEWPEIAKTVLPIDTVWLKLEHLGEDKRKIMLD